MWQQWERTFAGASLHWGAPFYFVQKFYERIERPLRRLLLLLLSLAIIFSLSACSKKTDPPDVSSEPEQMEFSEIQWPDTEIAKLMPVPKSNIGNINWSKDYGFVIYVAETSLDDYAAYVQECEALGFTLECRKGDDYFYADNEDGYHVALNYKEGDVMFVRIDEPKDETTEPPADTSAPTETPPDQSLDISTPPSASEPSGEETPPGESNLLYYSTNTLEQAKKGNSGVFAYKRDTGNYYIYWIVNFDEGCAYTFIYGNGDGTCDRVQIDDGDLNSYITVTYHDGDSSWQYGLCFKWARQPDRLIQSEEDGTQYEFIATDLNDALKIRDGLEIVDY